MCRRIDAFTRFRWEGDSPRSVCGASGSQAVPSGRGSSCAVSLQIVGLASLYIPYPSSVDKKVCVFVRKKCRGTVGTGRRLLTAMKQARAYDGSKEGSDDDVEDDLPRAVDEPGDDERVVDAGGASVRRPGVDDAQRRAGGSGVAGPGASTAPALFTGTGPARHPGRRRWSAGRGAALRRHGEGRGRGSGVRARASRAGGRRRPAGRQARAGRRGGMRSQSCRRSRRSSPAASSSGAPGLPADVSRVGVGLRRLALPPRRHPGGDLRAACAEAGEVAVWKQRWTDRLIDGGAEAAREGGRVRRRFRGRSAATRRRAGDDDLAVAAGDAGAGYRPGVAQA